MDEKLADEIKKINSFFDNLTVDEFDNMLERCSINKVKSKEDINNDI